MGPTVAALLGLGVLLAGGPALGQGGKTPERGTDRARLDALAQKVEDALKGSADAASALVAVQELRAQLADLEAHLRQARDATQGQGELRLEFAKLGQRLEALELRLTSVKQELEEKQVTAGFSDGFYLRSPMRRYLLQIRGFIQGAYTARLFSEAYDYTGGTLGETESTFELRRAHLEFSGNVITKFIKYRLELAEGTEDPGPVLEAYGDLRIFGPLQLRFGRQKIPVSRQFLTHSAYQQFTERSDVVREYAPGWDLGLVLHGEVDWFGPVTYQLGIFNGGGDMAQVNDNIDFLYSARLVYEPFGSIPYAEGDYDNPPFKLSVGGSFAFNLAPTDRDLREGETDAKKAALLKDADDEDGIDNVGLYMASAEVTARMRFLLWHSEVFYRVEDPGAVGPTRRFFGAFTQLGTVPRVNNYEFAVRYGYRQPHYYGLSRNVPRPEQIHEASAVASLFAWKRRLKWQLEYTFQYQQDLQIQQGTTITNLLDYMLVHQIRFQTQLYF